MESILGVSSLESSETIFEPIDYQNEFRLVNHYCRCMCEFFSVKEPKWNFYSMVSNHYAYRYTPLRYSLLAWSGLHLSIVEKTSSSLSKTYYKSALSLVMKENFHSSSVPIELLLASAYFLALYDLMEGTGNTVFILKHVWSTLKIGNIFESDFQSSDRKLSAFAYQIITWLIYIDIKSALFIGNINFPDYIFLDNSKDQNLNIQYLTVSEVYESKTVLNIFQHSRHVLSDIYGKAYPKENVMTDNTQDKILVLMVKNMLLLGSLIRLRCWLELCGNSTDFDPQSLKKKIHLLYQESMKLYQYENDKEDVTLFHILIINALIHSSIIYFDRICHPDIRSNDISQKSANEILGIALKLKNLRGIGTPGSLQWPLPMFIAGIETTDDIQKDWIRHELDSYEAEGWGLHIGKMKTLLQHTWDEQDKISSRVDVGKIMQDSTGYFVI